MKNATKIALAMTLVTGVAATALTVDGASARGWGNGWNNNQQDDDWQGRNWKGQRGNRDGYNRGGRNFNKGSRGGRSMGMMGGRMGSGMRGGMMMMQDFDTNKDQALSKEELAAGLEKKIADNDKDGDNAVSLEEFKAEWAKLTQQMMVRAFQRMDRDGNGKVELKEISEPATFMFSRADTNNDGKIDSSDMSRRGSRGGRGFFMQQQAPAPAPAPDTKSE